MVDTMARKLSLSVPGCPVLCRHCLVLCVCACVLGHDHDGPIRQAGPDELAVLHE